MIKLIVVFVAPLLVIGSAAQAGETAHRTVKRHYDTIRSETVGNAAAWPLPYYASSAAARRRQVHYDSTIGQDAQPSHMSIPPYLEGTCWDLDTCD